MGNPDLEFQNLNPDFPIERKIRKRISPPRNPSSGCISIKKSKSGFFGFPFLSFVREIRKRILVNSGISCANYIVRCSREQFSKSFFGFSNRTTKREIQKIRIWSFQLKSTLRTDFSEVKFVFGFRV